MYQSSTSAPATVLAPEVLLDGLGRAALSVLPVTRAPRRTVCVVDHGFRRLLPDPDTPPWTIDAALARVGIRCYHGPMAVKKLSVALDEGVADRASASAGRLGLSLSAWLNRAAENSLAIEDGLAAVAEWESEHGELSDEELGAAEAVLHRPILQRKSRRKSWAG